MCNNWISLHIMKDKTQQCAYMPGVSLFTHLFKYTHIWVNHTYDSKWYSHNIKIFPYFNTSEPFDWWLGLWQRYFNLKGIMQTELEVGISLITPRKANSIRLYILFTLKWESRHAWLHFAFECVTVFHSSNAKIIHAATGNKRSNGSNWTHLLRETSGCALWIVDS